MEGSACTRAHFSAESIVNHSRHRQRIQPYLNSMQSNNPFMKRIQYVEAEGVGKLRKQLDNLGGSSQK